MLTTNGTRNAITLVPLNEIGIGYQVSDTCDFFSLKYRVSGIRYLISRYQVSVSGIGFRVALKYRLSDTQKKTRYLTTASYT